MCKQLGLRWCLGKNLQAARSMISQGKNMQVVRFMILQRKMRKQLSPQYLQREYTIPRGRMRKQLDPQCFKRECASSWINYTLRENAQAARSTMVPHGKIRKQLDLHRMLETATQEVLDAKRDQNSMF